MGWVEGGCPPGRTGSFAEAFTVLDHLLCAHVLAYRAVHAVQPDAEVTVNTSSSSIYEHDRLLTDLLCARAAGVGRGDLDAWIDGRRARHGERVPARGPVEPLLRRLFADASPYGTAPDSRLHARLAAPSGRRLLDVLDDGGDGRPLDATGFDWYDPVAAHALRLPGRRTAGGRQWAPSRPIWDVLADPAGLTRWCRDQHELVPGLPLWVVENGLCTRVRNGRNHARGDGWDRPRYLAEHVAAVVDAVAAGVPVTAYLHWSLVDNYEWGSYEPRFGIFGLDRSRGPRGFRWLDTDADGRDSAAAYRRLIAWARQGAEGPAPTA
jgi:beta-glucosidase/6-phospho-beta-glucosidase/beta-galactosidase